MSLADGCRVDLDCSRRQLRLIAHLKEGARLEMQGDYSATNEDQLSGVITRIDIAGPNLSLQTCVAHPFDLWYVQAGDSLTVTKFTGGGWDEQGEENFRGQYSRSPSADSAPPASPRSDEGQTLVTGHPGENLRIVTTPRPGITSIYEEEGDTRRVGVHFKLWD